MEMGQQLRGKVVAIAGASRGLGVVAARTFSEAGARVAMLARSRKRLEEEAASLGPSALPIVTDIGDPDSVRDAFARIGRELGRLDVLVNNAGVVPLASAEDATDEQIASAVGTNFLGPIYTMREAIPLLLGAGGGHIINVSTEATLYPEAPFLSLYASTKSGMETFSRAAYMELRPKNIHVTVLLCGVLGGSRDRPDGARPDGKGVVVAREEADLLRFAAALQASGHAAIFGAPGVELEEVAEAMLFLATRPSGVGIDRLHVRTHNEART